MRMEFKWIPGVELLDVLHAPPQAGRMAFQRRSDQRWRGA